MSTPHALLALYPRAALRTERAVGRSMQRMVRPLAGAQGCTESQNCPGFPLLLAGTIRVVKNTASGRERVLYRVEPGGSCLNG